MEVVGETRIIRGCQMKNFSYWDGGKYDDDNCDKDNNRTQEEYAYECTRTITMIDIVITIGTV